jgi:hypothetical protein
MLGKGKRNRDETDNTELAAPSARPKNSLTAFSFIDKPYSQTVSSSVSQHIPRERKLVVEEHLGSGTFKDVYNASVDNKHKQIVLSRFKGSFNAKAVDEELRFAGKLYQHGLCTLPTHIKRRGTENKWVTIKKYLDTPFDVDNPANTLDTGAEFLTQKLECGNAMFNAMGGVEQFFGALRTLCEELIDRVGMVYVDVKVDNVCYDPKTQRIKIVDVDRQFFNELALLKTRINLNIMQESTTLQGLLRNTINVNEKQAITTKIKALDDRLDIAKNLIDTNFPYYYQDYKTHLINYMIFQTVLVGKNSVSDIDLQRAGLNETSVKSMLQFLLNTNNYFTSISEYHTPVGELTWYARRAYNADSIKKYFIDNGADKMYHFIMTNTISGGRRRTIRRKSLRNKKSRKNGKK